MTDSLTLPPNDKNTPNASYCKQCGTKLESTSRFCPNCGVSNVGEVNVDSKRSNKSAVTALLLCLFLGALGIHRFYVGKIGTGILMLLTAGGLGIWSLIDLIRIALGDFTDRQGNYLQFSRNPSSSTGRVLLIIGLIFASFILFILLLIAFVFYLTSGITEAVKDQLAALRSGNLEKAYSYTSNAFQAATPYEEFKRFIDYHPSLKDNQDSTFNERSIDSNRGSISGTLKATDGTETSIKYDLIKENGQWKILYMKLSPTGVEPTPDEGVNSERTTIENKAISALSETAVENLKLTEEFKNEANKYSINYPANWEITQPDNATVIIGGKPGTSSYNSSVNIQTVLTKKTGGHYGTLDEFMKSLKKQAMAFNNAKILAEDKIDIEKTDNRMAMKGRYMVFTYTYKGMPIKQLQYIFLRDDGQVFYTWGYTTTTGRFDVDYPIAKKMFTSWSVY